MKNQKRISGKAIMTNMILALLVGTVISFGFGGSVSPLVAGGAVFSIGTLPQIVVGLVSNEYSPMKSIALMGLQKEVWIQDIKEVLFAGNEFWNHSVDHSEFVSDKIVHVPQSGANPNTEKNRTVFPATITERADTELVYTLDEYSTDPIRVRNIDEIQTSYGKRNSVLGQNSKTIVNDAARNTLFDWAAPAANVIQTSGGLETFKPAGATGTRKAITLADIQALGRLFDSQEMPEDGRFLLLPSDMYWQLHNNSDVFNNDFMGVPGLPSGVIRDLFGFNIMKRSSTVIYDVANAAKAVDAASAATDNLAALAWHDNEVSKAIGDVDVFLNEGVAEHYGDIMSAMLLSKGSKLRSTNDGVAAIVQVA